MLQKAFLEHADSLGLKPSTYKYHDGYVILPDPQNTDYPILGFEYSPQGYRFKAGWISVSWFCNETSYHSTMKMDRFLNLKADDIKEMAEMVKQTDKAWYAAKESGKVLKSSIHEIIKGEVQLS